MKFQIKHEIKGRLRIHMKQSRMTFEQADILHYAIQKMDGVSSVKVYERTGDAVICFHCSREELIDALSAFDYDAVNVPMEVLQNSGLPFSAGRNRIFPLLAWKFSKLLQEEISTYLP